MDAEDFDFFAYTSFFAGIYVDADGATNARSHIQIIDDGQINTAQASFQTTAGTWTADSPYGFSRDELKFSGSGGAARWQFTGLTPGRYRVATTWKEDPVTVPPTPPAPRTTNASYTVNSGTPVIINQSVAPAAASIPASSKLSDAGGDWRVLVSSMLVTGGMITVDLTSGASNLTIADAVRIERLAASPVHTVPTGMQSGPPGAAIVFNDVNSNRISVSDIDAGLTSLQTTLTGTNGTVTLGAMPAGLVVTGNGTGQVTITGPRVQINQALDGLSFLPSAQTGLQLAITTNDLGNAGSGASLSDTDAVGLSIDASLTINQPPMIENVTASAGTPASFVGLPGDTISFQLSGFDPEGGALTFELLAAPAGATLTGTGATRTFSWVADVDPGVYAVKIRVKDNATKPGADEVTYSVTILDATTLAAAVPPTPFADDDEYFISNTSVLSVTASPNGLLVGDSDPQGDPLRVVIKSYPSPSYAVTSFSPGTDGSFTFDPVNTYVGPVTFTYRAFDGEEFSNEATVTINVSGASNTPPTAKPDTYTIVNTGQPVLMAPSVLANDYDPDVPPQTLTAQLLSPPSHHVGPPVGSAFTLSSDGTFLYHPQPNYVGVDGFTYRTFDGQAWSSGTTVTINLQAAPTAAPVAKADAYSAVSGVQLYVPAPGVKANDTDQEQSVDQLVAYKLSDPSNAASFVFNAVGNGSFTYTSHPNFVGTDSFTYWVHDGSAYSNVTTVTINVAASLPPVAMNDSYTLELAKSSTLVADGSLQFPRILQNDSDPENQALTAVIVQPPARGTLQMFNALTGTFTYAPNAGFIGIDHFAYYVTDGHNLSNVAIVTIEVKGMYSPRRNTDDAPITSACGCPGADFSYAANRQNGALSGGVSVGPNSRDSLEHRSNTNPHVTLVLDTDWLGSDPLTGNNPAPSSVSATATIANVSNTVNYAGGGLESGTDEPLKLAIAVDATPLQTGSYPYTITVSNTYPGRAPVSQRFAGRVNLVNRGASEFGNRWSLASDDRLFIQEDGVLLVRGHGDSFWFQQLFTGNYQRAAGEPDFSELVKNGDNTYTLTARNGARSQFNSQGILTAWIVSSLGK